MKRARFIANGFRLARDDRVSAARTDAIEAKLEG
jgi:hypothetical protein